MRAVPIWVPRDRVSGFEFSLGPSERRLRARAIGKETGVTIQGIGWLTISFLDQRACSSADACFPGSRCLPSALRVAIESVRPRRIPAAGVEQLNGVERTFR